MNEVQSGRISWTGDTRVEHRPGYIYILYVVLQLLFLLYGDDALIVQLDKAKLNS